MLGRRFLGLIRHRCRCYSTVGNQNVHCGTIRTPVVEELVSQFGNRYLIKKLFKSHPELNDSDIYFWKTFTTVLFKFGFQPRDCFRMIGLYPSILACEEENLEKTLVEWSNRSCLPMSDLKFLLLNRPEFLKVSPDAVKLRIPFFLFYCPTKDLLLTFLFLCPNVMTDDWDCVLQKLDFFNEEMAVYKTEVLTCRAMTKSLEHIKLRFSVLEKCGMYTRPNIHSHKQTHKERLLLRNPKLKDITDKTDMSFAKKIAKISLEEYEVYSDLLIMQEKEEIDDDDSSDSSDEE